VRQSTFSARLSSKLNALYRKIFDRKLEYAGVLSDALHIRVEKTKTLDIASREVTSIDLVNFVFPRMEDIPMRKITNSFGQTRNSIYAKDREPFLLGAPIAASIDVDDLIIKLYDDVSADNIPWVIILQVKDALGTFGDRSLLYQKVQVTYFDENLPQTIIDYVTTMAARREIGQLGW
jgi:hypothetical protein